MSERTFFHFTSHDHLLSIIKDEAIRPTESNISAFTAHAGPDVVWLLDGPNALDAPHGLIGSNHEKREAYIEVKVPAIPWVDWTWTAKMDNYWRNAMIQTGGGEAAVSRWYVWPSVIDADRWVSIKTRGQVIRRDAF